QPAKLSGIVRDESGRPIAGAMITARGAQGGPHETRSATDGSFSLDIADSGELVVSFSAPAFTLRTLRIPPGETRHTLEIILSIARYTETITVAASRVAH